MLVFESKLEGTAKQYESLDEAIRTARFMRNSCLKYWQENQGIGRYDLSKYCAVLAECPDFPWAKKLNSMASKASAERAWSAARIFDNCKKKVAGKKGYPKFKKHQTDASVEYKNSGWKLSDERRYLTFTDGFEAGTFKLWGSRDLHLYQIKQIKRIRVVRRADGYAQFCIDNERLEKREPTGKTIGLDVGLNHFYTDSNGQNVDNPGFLRKSERALKRAQRRLSRNKKGSKNRIKARGKLGRKHLRVSRQRKDFAVKLARCVVRSNDLVAYEDMKVRNMVKNHHLAKSIVDASWSLFRQWVEYFGKVFGVVTVAVPPHYTSQNCSNCGQVVKKTLSTRTHKCPDCGYVADRDENAARNILELGLRTAGHVGISSLVLENVSGENDLCLGDENPLSKPTRRKRKSKL
ncbi:RNA-guided endonuclease InsQ/TnpB family protein [Microseira wollei]|uniref:Transposase n=1 Tax=Microseira wollei NIES-4236 TaxID=2530354 RepID=A0AAV3XPC3_9CYAN|nr:transposase [Microseira wollei]GET42055.1 transposase [Microseira wollei NIES-4236]